MSLIFSMSPQILKFGQGNHLPVPRHALGTYAHPWRPASVILDVHYKK